MLPSASIGRKQFLDERFAHIGSQGTTKQLAIEGCAWGVPTETFPSGWPVATGKIGLAAYRGFVSFTNLKVSDWDGNVLLFDDFASDPDGALPARYGQIADDQANFQVQTDLTAPSTAHKIIKQMDDVFAWSWLYLLADVLPADNRFIIEADVCSSGAIGLGGLCWYVQNDPEDGFGGYLSWDQLPSGDIAYRYKVPGAAQTDIGLGTRETARVASQWYHMKTVVQDANVAVYSDDDNGNLRLRFRTVASDKAVLLDTYLEDGVLGPGSFEGLWVAQNGYYTDPTVRIFVDDMDTEILEMPLREFLFNGGLPTDGYATRYQGCDLPGRANWRRFHIPYSSRLRVEIDNNQTGLAILFVQAWWRGGNPGHGYDYQPVYATDTVASLGWATLADITGAGFLSALYVEESCAIETFLEGNLRITVDGERVWMSSGTEDVPLASYYFTDGLKQTDFVGTIEHTEGPPVRALWYRYFIPDPIVFSQSLKVEIQNGQANQNPPGQDLTIRSLCEIFTK